MLAIRLQSENSLPDMEEIDRPSTDDNEVLVKMKAASICGSDAHKWDPEFRPDTTPVTLGHEGAGVIAEVGEQVTHLSNGDRVVLDYIVSCGECRQCVRGYNNRCRYKQSLGKDRDGTFAEYISVPAENAIKIADSIPFEWGSISGCAVGTAYHAVNVAELTPGDTVTIFGAGGVGLHSVMWADYFGAGSVIAVDVVESKLDVAESYGADVLVDATKSDPVERIMDETDGWGTDAAIECSGASIAMEQAISSIDGRNHNASGNVVSVGLQTEPMQAEYWGLREGKLAVSGNHTPTEFQEILELLEAGEVDLSDSITHTLPLEQIREGVDLLHDKEEHVVRAIIDFDL